MSDQVPCPKCGNPLNQPELVQSFVFAKDLKSTMDLLEGRLNSVICPLCQAKITFQTAVVIMNHDKKAILGALPKDVEAFEETRLYSLAEEKGFSLEICRDYDELRRSAVSWIDHYVVPIGSKLLSGEIDRLPLEQKVSLVTPFFLRVFKSSLDDYLPSMWQTSGGSPDQARQSAEGGLDKTKSDSVFC